MYYKIVIAVAVILIIGVLWWQPARLTKIFQPALMKLDYHVASGAANEIRGLVIKKYGIDKKHGLDMNIISADPGELERQLISGETDVAEVSPFSLITAYGKNRSLKIITPSIHFPYAIGIPKKSSVKTIQGLKGSRLGVLPKASAAYAALALTFKSAGLDPEKDFKLVFGNIPQTVEALQKGDVDAAMLSYPTAAKLFASGNVKDLGLLEPLWSKNENGLPMTVVVVAASEDWINKNKPTASKLVATLLDASKYIQQNPQAITGLTDYMNKNGYTAPEAKKLIEQNVPALLFSEWADPEMNALRKMFERAKEINLIPKNSPSADQFILPPSALGL